jgi:hypothetical protein
MDDGRAAKRWAGSRRQALGRIGAGVAGAAAIGTAGTAGTGAAVAVARQATPEPVETVPDDFKVVLHVSEGGHWAYVLSNLANLTKEWPRARIRVVADGTAVFNLQGVNHITDALAEAAAKGVEIQACPNALADQGIDRAALPAFVAVTVGGVVALVGSQRDGYAYVKP